MSERINSPRQAPCIFSDLGLMAYDKALDIQTRALTAKIQDPDLADRLFFVEHPPVFTLGRRGGAENLMVKEEVLAQRGVGLTPTDRGGNITYHGPGQAVLYPIVNLTRLKLAVPDLVWGLEEVMRLTCADLHVDANRDERNHGLWVKDAKIGSVGLSIKKGVCMHGLALNINPDLTPFSWINPCGIPHLAMTSVARERNEPEQVIGTPASPADKAVMNCVAGLFIHHFSKLFNRKITYEIN